ncbi:dihydroorotate dehydrogenase (quinone), mitochondrial [Elysia marginata]|uniref:Dihydroorotate dehydrogenase (quinone), mitochondrial n=1 Tax=Elysia marginata TaxID=1093978 RepID=A0AAV4JN87_9GAST|nr:dihydroorotate dehydrogenase (quinone), mitochondrial [Elysia marginata]
MDPKGNAFNGKFWIQLKQAAVIVNGGVLLFAGMNLYKGSEKFYDDIVMPLFQLFSPETSHNISIKLAKYKIVPKQQKPDPPSLQSKVWGRKFPNPLGLAAGYDKQGEAVDGLLKMGFGFVEVGSITPEPQPGNPQPRLFRLKEDRAVINRFGFNSDGHEVVYERLNQRKKQEKTEGMPATYVGEKRNMLNVNFWTETEDEREKSIKSLSWLKVVNRRKEMKDKVENGILGVNLGKNKTSPNAVGDYVKGVYKFGGLADYLVVNVSSPNTPGLRSMQKREELSNLLFQVLEARNKLTVNPKPPLLIKIAPDLDEDEKKDIAAVVLQPKTRVDGLIVSNTTVSRPDSLQSKHKTETGGLSGAPLTSKSLETIRDMYALTKGKESLSDCPCPGRPKSCVNDQTIASMKKDIDEDPHISVQELRDTNGLSYGTVHTIIIEHLRMKKVCAQWIPHLLTVDQKRERVRCATELLNIFERHGPKRLSNMVTGDETWFPFFIIPPKRLNCIWVDGQGDRPIVSRPGFQSRKRMFTVFFNYSGPLVVDILLQDTTMTAIYYVQKVLSQVKSAINEQRPKVRTSRTLLLHDNAGPHKARATTQSLRELGIQVLPHPAYGPDLAPCDFWLFPNLKDRLTGWKFDGIQDLAKAMNSELRTIPEEDYQGVFRKWQIRPKHCIKSHGEYFEGLRKFHVRIITSLENTEQLSKHIDPPSYSMKCRRNISMFTGEVPIVGVGGVSNGREAYDKIKAGASLIQMYTALVYHGPPVIGKIKREMDELLRQDGFSHISEAVGVEAMKER